MPLVDTDIKLYLSLKTGTAGNQSVQTNQNASLGKYISTSEWAGGVLHDLFDVISGSENAASTVDYRCVFVRNTHASISATSMVIWIASQVSGGASIQIGLDPTATSAIGSSSAQAVQITNETIAPAGVTFSTPTTEGAGLSIGTLMPGECKAVWIKRIAANSVALNSDGATLSISFDTTA